MTYRPLIMALDIATTTGFALGRVGDSPVAGSARFGRDDASPNAVFAHALTWLSGILEQKPRPDMLVIEAMLPPGAKVGYTNTEVRDRLAGLHGIMRAVAYLRGIYKINEVPVGDVRAHFIGRRDLERDAAKAEVMLRCHQLGWTTIDNNAGDALALWSYAVAGIDPDWSLQLSPLFNPKLRVHA
jgi:hypothetical protein